MEDTAVNNTDVGIMAVELALDISSLLLKGGASVTSAKKAAYAVCSAFNLKRACVLLSPCFVAVCAHIQGRDYTSLKRAYYGGNDIFLQEKCFGLTRKIVSGGISLTKAQAYVKQIENSFGAPPLVCCVGAALACGAFAVFFGGVLADGIISASAGFICAYVREKLSKRGTGGCARIFVLSLISGALAVIMCGLAQFFDVACHTSLVVVGTLMPLIPGLAVCNALSDILSGEFFSGSYRITGGLAYTLCIAFGYALALAASGGLTSFTLSPPRGDALHVAICYITCAVGSAGFCLTMNARKKRLLYGVAASLISYTVYVATKYFGAGEFLSYLAAAVAAYLAAQAPAKITKIPSTVYEASAIIPLLPGASLYCAVNALVCGDLKVAALCGCQTLVVFAAIAAGLSAAGLAARILNPKVKN